MTQLQHMESVNNLILRNIDKMEKHYPGLKSLALSLSARIEVEKAIALENPIF